MDFGSILDRWDNTQSDDAESRNKSQRKHPMDDLLDRYPVPDKDRVYESGGTAKGGRRSKYLKMNPQASLDLHGYTVKEAREKVIRFLKECKQRGYIKVLFIPGKGNHSANGGVLKKELRTLLQNNSMIGEIGEGKKEWGGSGTMWAIIR